MLRLFADVTQLLYLFGHEFVEFLDAAHPLLFKVLRVGLLVQVFEMFLENYGHFFMDVIGDPIIILYNFRGVVLLPLGAHPLEVVQCHAPAIVYLLSEEFPGF